jgi:hypothetical protein
LSANTLAFQTDDLQPRIHASSRIRANHKDRRPWLFCDAHLVMRVADQFRING